MRSADTGRVGERVGGRVGYVMKMYPRLAETFILNEILAHEAAGLKMEIFSLRSPIDGRFHQDLGRVRAHVTYLPGPATKAQEFWTTLSSARQEFAGAKGLADYAAGESASTVYQAIALAREVRDRRVVHLHAHFATAATAVTRLAARLAGVRYSFTAHAKDIFHEEVQDRPG